MKDGYWRGFGKSPGNYLDVFRGIVRARFDVSKQKNHETRAVTRFHGVSCLAENLIKCHRRPNFAREGKNVREI